MAIPMIWLRRAAPLLLALTAIGAQAYDLQFNAVTDVDPVPTRGVLQYTVQIENSAADTATDVRTVFAIPSGATVEGGALALPSSALANCSVTGAYVVCSHGSLAGTAGAGGSSLSFVLRFRAPSTLGAPPNVNLRGAIGRGAPPLATVQGEPLAFFAAGSSFWAGDTNPSNNTSAAPSPLQQTTIESNAELSVAVVASPNPVVSGARVVYTVTVTNNGPNSNPTTGVRVLATVPAGGTYVPGSAAGAGWAFSGPGPGASNLTATRGGDVLAVGTSQVFSYAIDVAVGNGTLSSSAVVDTDRSVGGALLDNLVGNNTAAVVVTITPGADLTLGKAITAGASPHPAGAAIAMRLSPRNLGQGVATGVVVRDVLPAGHSLPAIFPLPPGAQAVGPYSCRTNAAGFNDLDAAEAGRAARTILRCTRANMPVGEAQDIDFSVVTDVATSGNFSNVASVASDLPDPAPANNSARVDYSVLPNGADVALVAYNRGPLVVAATGGTITNSVSVRNNGPQAIASNLQTFVVLGAGEAFVGMVPGWDTWTCVAEAPGVRCTYLGPYPVLPGATSGSGSFQNALFYTRANAPGPLSASACVGGSGGSAEPTVNGFAPGSVTDIVTGNDCSGGVGITSTAQLSDLSVTKATSTPVGGDKVVGAGENSVTFTLVATNQGPAVTPGVVISDYLPGFVPGATAVSVCGYVGAGTCTPPGLANLPAVVAGFNCSMQANRLYCTNDNNPMGVGAANAVTLVVQVAGALQDSAAAPAESGCSLAGQYCNRAGVAVISGYPGGSLDPNLNNNEGRDAFVVQAAANIQTQSKTFSPALAQVGADTAYTINYRNPAGSRSDLPSSASPGAGVPAGVVFVDTFNLAANDPGFVLRSANVVAGGACNVTGTTGGVVATPATGGTSYSSLGRAAGTVRIECPAVALPRNTDRQLSVVVRPNVGAVGALTNTASFRLVDGSGAAAASSAAGYDFNTDASAADDTKTATVNLAVGTVDLRIENSDLLDPVPWDPAFANVSPGGSDFVHRVQVRNAGPALATGTRFDFTITPPPGSTVRFVGDEAGTAVTMATGATAAQRCTVQSGSNPVVAPATLTLRCAVPGYGATPNTDGVLAQGTLASEGSFLNLRMRFESVPSVVGSTVRTNAVVAADQTDADSSNNAESEETTVRARADLAISKTGFVGTVPALPGALPAAQAVVGLGQPFNWVLDVVNNGPTEAWSTDRTGTSPLNGTGTVITDTLPVGVIVTGPITWQKLGSSGYAEAVVNGSGTCTQAAQTVRCTVGDVANAGRVRVTLPVRWEAWPANGGAAALSEAQTNNAAVASEQLDPTPTNNTASHTVQVARASLGGVVFEDRDRTGANSGTQQAPGIDPPMAGVTVVLRAPSGVDAYGNAFAPRTTQTDANGAYNFGDLPAGSFDVVQAQPAGYSNSPGDPSAAAPGAAPSLPGAYQAVGAVPAGAPVPAGANSRYNGVVLGAQQAGQRFNFPELRQNSLAGVVYVDSDLSNRFEPGVDTPIAGATVLLRNAAAPGAVLQSTTTGADGSYRFAELDPSLTYILEQPLPSTPVNLSNRPTAVNVGTVAGTASGTAAPNTPSAGTDRITGIVLAGAGDGVQYNFGETMPQQLRIAGTVYLDADRDGALTAADTVRLPGVVLRLVAGPVCTGTVIGTTTTAADGGYAFTDANLVAPNTLQVGGVYSVCQTQPAGYDDAAVNPGNGASVGGINHIVIGALPIGNSVGNNFAEVLLSPDLVVTKALAPSVFTESHRGSYTLTVANLGQAASNGVYTVTDTLPAGLTAMASTAAAPNPRGTGWSCAVAGQSVTCTSSQVLAAGASSPNPITLDVQVAQALCAAGSYPCNVDNRVQVLGGGELPARQPTAAELANPPLCTAAPTQSVCRLPTPIRQAGGVSGQVWLDVDHDRRYTPGSDLLQGGFTVELFQAGALMGTTTTNAQGQYQFLGLLPGNNFELRFRDSVTGAYYGRPVSTDPAGGNDPRATGPAGVVPTATLSGFTVPGGGVRVNQNLPLDPSGVVYNSVTRQPVPGALVELLSPSGARVPAQCVLGGVNSITTASGGTGTVPGGYAFWLLSPTPAGCPGDGVYQIRVTPPTGYLQAGVPSTGGASDTSQLIPAQSGTARAPSSCQGYVLGAPCAIQNQASAPTGTQPTPYFFGLNLTPSNGTGGVDFVNNNIPLDPLRNTRFAITKQASKATVEVGDVVGYTITVKHLEGAALPAVQVEDRLPAGFRYVMGTLRIAGVNSLDPAGAPGPNLRFDLGTLPVNGQITFTYATRAGVGAQQGDGINTAQAVAGVGNLAQRSNVATARVRVTGGVFSHEACVTGKVYVDCNNNQVQGAEELGIPGVRLVLQDGTWITTDVEGKYSLCGLPPRTHVLKADLLTLPRGSRLVTSSSRNAGDANSIFLDLKNGDLQRADFIEGSCSNTVLEQVKARRSQGEVRAAETEKKTGPALKFEGKAAGYPQQGTDSANQKPVRTRESAPVPRAPVKDGVHEQNLPVPELPAASPRTQRQ